MADFFNSQMDYIFFFYGLAFILLVPICHLLNRRSSRLLTWGWLGLFGAAHGLNEWLGLLTLGWGSNTAFNLGRLVLATGSFVFLVEFGRAGTINLRGRGPGRWILAALLGVSLGGFFAGLSGFAAVSRYVLGFGGGLWAAGALYLASQATGAGRRGLQGAALGMLVYALTNLVPTPAPFFPAAQLNSESFLAMTGLPIQLVKGLLALWIVAYLSILAQASLVQDTEYRIRVWGRTLIFGAAAAVIALLVTGWFTTQYFGDDTTHEIRTNQENHAKVLYRAMIDSMEETDHLVSTLAGSLRIPPALKNWDVQTIEQANISLDRYSQIYPGVVCYLMNLDGLTVASSKRGETDSFVGMSYRFRPYFLQAIQGTPGRYWALGVTSKKIRYYASYPVRDPAGKIVGVAVFKRLIGDVEQFFPAQSVGFIIDSHGMVFMANRPEMVLQSLWPLSLATREQLLASRQFGPGPITPILTREPVDRAEAWFQGKKQLVLRQPFPWEDWSLILLSPMRPIILGRLMGIALTLLLCLGVIAFLTILGLTIDTTARIQSSERQYRLVFQNNPVGIFHFDKTGTVTDCNERFAELIGAPKEKIIGFNLPRQLQNEKIREAILTSMQGLCSFYEGDYLSVLGSKLTSVRVISQGILSPANEFLGGVGIFEDFTVRRQALEALRESEEKYRLVFEKAPLGIMHYDQTSTITQCNEKFAEIIGAPKEEFIGFNMIRQLQDEKLREAVATSLQGEVGYYEGDYLSVTAGKLTPVRVIFQPLFSLDGALSGGVTIFEDITERKRAEEALRKSEAGLADAQRIVHLGNWEWDIQQNVVSWSDEIYRIFGAAPQGIEASFKSFLKLVHPGDRHLVKQALATSLYHGQPYSIAHRVVQPTGLVRFVQGMGEVTFDEADRPLRLVGTLQDITARKEAVDALREHLNLFQTLIDTIPSPLFYKNVEGIYLGCNKALADFLGLPKEEIIGKSVYDIYPKDLADKYFEMDSALFQNPGVQIYDFSMLHADGTIRDVNFNKATYATIDGTLAGLVGVMIDITDRKKAEGERLHFNKLESLGTLAGGIAHDFNNILTVILGNISLAMLDQNEVMIRKRLTAADRACLQAQTLAQQLLTFARGGAPIKELASVAELVSEAGSFSCTGSNVRCEFNFPDNLWAVEADPGQISQVFQNLVINAIQAMPTGGTVGVRCENLEITDRSNLPLDPGKYIKISFHDQGLGIPAEYLPQIFDPYFTTKQRGSGLGLATAHSILQNHHGHIAVESQLGQGTTFHVYLPASDQQIIQPPKKAKEVLTGQGKILLMDDEEMVRQTLDKMLGHLGYQVTLARDGKEAIELFTLARESGQPFDAVILDLTVPGGMGGQETMEKLLQIDPQVKAVVSSGYSEDSIMAESERYGFSGVIAKPYRIAELSKVLNKVLRAIEQ